MVRDDTTHPALTRELLTGRGAVFLAITVLLGVACVIPAVQRLRGEASRIDVAVALAPHHALCLQLVAGTSLEVALIIPSRDSPHTFVPRPSDVARLSSARLLLADGIHDGIVQRLAAAATPSPEIVLLSRSPEVAAAMPPGFAFDGEHEHSHGEEHAHDHGDVAGNEPVHAWLDPVAARATVLVMAREIAARWPEHAARLEDNRRALESELAALDVDLRARVARLPRRDFIAFHSAFDVFAARYGLELIAVVQPVSGVAPTLAHVARLHEIVDTRKVRALFTEPQLSRNIAVVMAEELSVELYELDPMGDANLATPSYSGMMLRVMETLERALTRP